MLQLSGYHISPDKLAEVRNSRSFEDIEKRVGIMLADMGFTMATYHLLRLNGNGDKLLNFFSSYPDEWLDRYIEKGYLYHDVVHSRSRKTVVPFSWRDCQRLEIPTKAGLIFSEATEFGVHDGFTVPIHSHRAFAIFSVVAQGTAKERAQDIAQANGALTILGLNIHERACELLEHETPVGSDVQSKLTPRELECLRWSAAGKNTSVIADILHISTSTVDAHIHAAMRKLNAQTRTHAVVRALSLGIIPIE